MPSPPVRILLVEDSQDDADLMTRALREGTLDVQIQWEDDGEKAINYLRRHGPHEAAPRPDLIVLDLHLPVMNGHEVLAEIKQDPELRVIPVVMMTSYGSDETTRQSYDLHANCCVDKPSDQEQYACTVQKIEQFWLRVARRPRGH
jgi:CheY-like chemotaxis protein